MEGTEQRLKEAQEWLQKEYAGIRTGQASPALLDGLKVDSYGSLVPLNQVGTVGVEDARTLRISTWDAGMVSTIEQVIRDANLGVSTVGDSSGIRVIFPELTAERRTQLVKLAKTKLEDARVRVRGVRDEAIKSIDKLLKDGEISEDEKFTQKEAIQKQIEAINKSLEALCDQKEASLNK